MPIHEHNKKKDESKTAHPSASVQRFLIQIGSHVKTTLFTILPLVRSPMNDKVMGKELKKNIKVIAHWHDVFLGSERLKNASFNTTTTNSKFFVTYQHTYFTYQHIMIHQLLLPFQNICHCMLFSIFLRSTVLQDPHISEIYHLLKLMIRH
jgi:hypothetical protein